MIKLSNSSIENYEIIKEIGKGSFSTVYLVKKIDTQKEYALKKVNILKMKDKERQNSFKEINFLSEIKDPNVIGYEESFYDKNLNYLYVIMEYAPYGDLAKILLERKKKKEYYTENELLNIYLQIASGLKAIHTKQIIHRDLKSANIFITQKNDLILKIGDFNVSKKIDYLNLKNTQTGTPYYASPEIWENRPYDLKSDIWSLGCLFYEIASFSTPFKGGNMNELYENILKVNMPPLPKQYSNNIDKIIKMCLRKDASLRPNINDIKFFIENLKLEQHFKKFIDGNFLDINNNNNLNLNNIIINNNIGMKRQTSYIKNSGNLIMDNKLFQDNNDNLNIRLKKDYTPIKQNHFNYLLKYKTPIKLTRLLNMNLNLINNNNSNIKENYINNSNIYKTDNNLIIKNSSKVDKKYFNLKLKPPPYKRLKIINSKFEENNKLKEERKDNNYKKEEFSSKFNTLKNPLIQNNEKSSSNNSQSIPELINNSLLKNKNDEISNTIKITKELKLEKLNEVSDINNNINTKKEKNKNLYLKGKSNKDILVFLNPNKLLSFKKKLNNLSTLNLHNLPKNPIKSLMIQMNQKNTNDNIDNIDDKNENKIKNLSKIKLKPIIPSKRSKTPFTDDIPKKPDISKNNNIRLKYNYSNIKLRNMNDYIMETNNTSNINTENNNIINNNKSDKKYFLRKLKFDRGKINNLSQIKTKFSNFIKPNLKNFPNLNFKTEF